MRYREKKTVAQALEWLAGQGVRVHRDTYQSFLRRVLGVMPDAVAKQLGVDLALLRAIRCRLKLPVTPRRGRIAPPKATLPFQAKSRQRRVDPVKRGKAVRPTPPTPVRLGKRERPDANQFPLPGMVGLPGKAKEVPKMIGTREKPAGYGDWKIINGEARDKLHGLDRQIMANYEGMVIHLKTRKEYTPEDLVALYELTPTEAQSCFMTFNDVT